MPKVLEDGLYFHLACLNGHLEVVDRLVAIDDVDLNAKNSNEWTSVHLACSKGNRSWRIDL